MADERLPVVINEAAPDGKELKYARGERERRSLSGTPRRVP